MNLSFLRTLVTLLTLSFSDSYSSGSGHCNAGIAFPTSSPHISTQGDSGSGSLSVGNYHLSIDEDPLNPTSLIVLATGKEHTITLGNTANANFRGFLFRLSGKEGENVKSSIQASPDFGALGQDSWRCANDVGGITHKDGSDKSAVAIVLSSENPIDMLLEVTVVKNSNAGSWHFDSYDIRFEIEATDTPTAIPSSQPSSSLSVSPSITASGSPSSVASLKPSIAASYSPSVSTSNSPSIATSTQPTLAPTISPSLAPTLAASNPPTKVTSENPSAEPSISGASSNPSTLPSPLPSMTASDQPSFVPSHKPSITESNSPSKTGSSSPSIIDSKYPSTMPTLEFSGNPSSASPESSDDAVTSSAIAIPKIYWKYTIFCTAIIAFML